MIDIQKRKKRQQKYYARKRNEHRCVTCGKQDERTLQGFVYCEECNVKRHVPYDPAKRSEERKNRENADKREWARMMKAKQICVICGRKDKRTVDGRSQCLFCATRLNERARERRKTETGDKLRAQGKARRKRWEEQGRCSNCGGPKEEPEFKMCIDCRMRSKLNRKRREREAGKRPRGADGKCFQCNKKPRMEGKKLCAECYAAKIRTIQKSGFIKGGKADGNVV